MFITIGDFELEWDYGDHVIHTADYADLIEAYEKELKENKIIDVFLEKLKQEYDNTDNIPHIEKEFAYEMANKVAKQLAEIKLK